MYTALIYMCLAAPPTRLLGGRKATPTGPSAKHNRLCLRAGQVTSRNRPPLNPTTKLVVQASLARADCCLNRSHGHDLWCISLYYLYYLGLGERFWRRSRCLRALLGTRNIFRRVFRVLRLLQAHVICAACTLVAASYSVQDHWRV